MAAALGSCSGNSLSSRDMRVSAVELDMPCDSGEGRAGRGVGTCKADAPDWGARLTEEAEDEDEGLR